MIDRPQRWLGGAVVVAILIATALAALAGVRHERSAVRDERARLAAPAIRTLAAELGTATAALEDLRAFYEASDQVTEADFRRFTASPLARQSALRYLAWTPVVDGQAVEGLVAGPAARDARAPERLAAPEGRAAAAEARDAARPRMTGPLPGEEQPTTLLVAPVYEPGASLDSVDGRREGLRGYVSAVARLGDLADPAGAALPTGVELVVTDEGRPVIGRATDDEPEGAIAVGGREWSVGVAGVDGPSHALPLGLGGAGVLLAGVVALLLRSSADRERATRRELAGLRVRHDMILGSAGDGIVGLDRDLRVSFVNPAAARMLGWGADDLTGGRFDELAIAEVGPAVRAGRGVSGEGPVRRRDGSRFVGEFTATPIVEDGIARGAVVVFRDVTARKEREERTRESLAAAEEMAAVDALTGLANHRTFHERLATELERSRRNDRGLALVLMDLDRFKQVNDRFGHQAGDRVLRHAARVLQQHTRTGELVARVGGEEFAMILPEADAAEAFRAAERVRRAIAAATFPEIGHMTMSAGVCDLSDAGDAETLYRLADGALYWAKHSGRDRVVRHSPETPSVRPTRADALAADRRQALVSVRLLARVVDSKDPSTRRHSERVADLAAEIARALGWAPGRIDELREAALLHDVGKVGIPDELLLAPRALTPDEMERMRAHAEAGARILADALTPEQVAWVRGHHERWDGSGYPDGLTMEECPEGARILALAEAWDTMTSERPYSPMPRTTADALAECRACAGGQFWPAAVAALERIRGAA